MRILSLLITICLLTGCLPIDPSTTSVCKNAPTESFICQTVEEKGIQTEALTDLIVSVNFSGISFGTYSPKDVQMFTKSIRGLLLEPLTYRALLMAIYKYGELTRKKMVNGEYTDISLIVISKHLSTFQSDILVSEYDRKLVLRLMDYMDQETEFVTELVIDSRL